MKRLSLLIAAALLLTQPLLAHEGHEHGDEKKALPNLGDTPPRLPDGVVFVPKPAQRQKGVLTLKVVEQDQLGGEIGVLADQDAAPPRMRQHAAGGPISRT